MEDQDKRCVFCSEKVAFKVSDHFCSDHHNEIKKGKSCQICGSHSCVLWNKKFKFCLDHHKMFVLGKN